MSDSLLVLPFNGRKPKPARYEGMTTWSHSKADTIMGSGCPYARKLGKEVEEDITSFHMSKAGSIWHQLLELYYSKGWPTVSIDFEAGKENDNWLAAWHMFEGYRNFYGPDELGKVVAVEEELWIDDPVVVGVAPWTFIIDLVVYMDEEQVAEVETGRGIDLAGPGYYIVDHKSMGQKWRTTEAKQHLSFQFPSYVMGWEALHPDKPIAGIIANCAVNHKDNTQLDPKSPSGLKSFMSYAVEAPMEWERERVRAWYREAARREEVNGKDFKNTGYCVSLFGVCPFADNGLCNRNVEEYE